MIETHIVRFLADSARSALAGLSACSVIRPTQPGALPDTDAAGAESIPGDSLRETIQPPVLARQLNNLASLLKRHDLVPPSCGSRLIFEDPKTVAAAISRDLEASRDYPLIATVGDLASSFSTTTISHASQSAVPFASVEYSSQIISQLAQVFVLVMENSSLANIHQNFIRRRGYLSSGVSLTVASPFFETLFGSVPIDIGKALISRRPSMGPNLRTQAARDLFADYQKHLPLISGAMSLGEIAALDDTHDLWKDLGEPSTSVEYGWHAPDPLQSRDVGATLPGYADLAENIAVTDFVNCVAERNPNAVRNLITQFAPSVLQRTPANLRARITEIVVSECQTDLTGAWYTISDSGSFDNEWLPSAIISRAQERQPFAKLPPAEFDRLVVEGFDPNSPIVQSLSGRIGEKLRRVEKAILKTVNAEASYRRDLRERVVDAFERRVVPDGAFFAIVNSYHHLPGFIDDERELRRIVRELPDTGIKLGSFLSPATDQLGDRIRALVKRALEVQPGGGAPVIGVTVGSTANAASFAWHAYGVWPHVEDRLGRPAIQLDSESDLLNVSVICSELPDLGASVAAEAKCPSVSFADHFIAWLTGDLKSIRGEPMRQGVAVVEPVSKFTGAELRYFRLTD